MKRLIEDKIKQWALDKNEICPLFILGARQVGKTYSVRKVADELFKDNSIYINFMDKDEYYKMLDGKTNCHEIIKNIEYLSNKKIDENTLIIFDEVQEIPSIKTSLKSFVEANIKTKIICLGSYLGNLASNVDNYSFPVGKVKRLYMYPLSYEEFVIAKGQKSLLDEARNALKEKREVNRNAHHLLMDMLYNYMIIGGMPEIVKMYLNDDKLIDINVRKKELIDDYKLDISKTIMSNSNKVKAMSVYDNLPTFLAKENKKYMLSKIDKTARYLNYEVAIKNLLITKMIYKVSNLKNISSSLIDKVKENEFKIYYNDCGFLSTIFNINKEILMNTKDNVYSNIRGSIAENFAVSELRMKMFDNKLNYYSFIDSNINSNTSYEVDFVIEDNKCNAIPLEIKFGKDYSVTSLNKVIKDNNPAYALVFHAKNFSYDEERRVYKLPLYFLSIIEIEDDRLKFLY